MLKLNITPKFPNIIDKLSVTVCDLADYKHLIYNEFIEQIINIHNEPLEDGEEYMLTKSYFNTKVYHHPTLVVEMYNHLTEEDEIYTLNNCYTNGEILYQIAQQIPTKSNIEQYQRDYIASHFNSIIRELENNRNMLNNTVQLSRAEQYLLRSLNEDYNSEKISYLMANSDELYDYMIAHCNNIVVMYCSDDIFEGNLHFQGLSYYKNMYRLSLG